MAIVENCFTPFQSAISAYTLPERFTFPFYYEPHPLSLLAAKELQVHIETQTAWKHNFWDAEKASLIIGKMFGVLVVQNQAQEIGYLAAFSGKLANSNHHEKFVPPVYDMLTEGSFLNQGMAVLNSLNQQVKDLEELPAYLERIAALEKETALAATSIQAKKAEVKAAKKIRKIRRQEGKEKLSLEEFEALQEELRLESIRGNYELKDLARYWKRRLPAYQAQVDFYQTQIDTLKAQRKNKSASLQKQLFEEYQFLNQAGEVKSLLDIFQDKVPIGGAGECAAPKLLQYAFQHQMKPIAMAEFWWGQSPKSAIRKHKQFYPACLGKCRPILRHMLDGMLVDENPLLKNPAEGKVIDIIYEDAHLLVINKPAEFLSVPGRKIKDSVALRMQVKYPDATGPMVAHRLDMSTSGLMLVSKSLEVHRYLQYQFAKRIIKKRYVALLEGIVAGEEGVIDLPLQADWYDRPRQMVCYTSGKPAQTKWKVLSRDNQQTRIHFFPITGRTHQLRVHAAHTLGLNHPIIGDDLYGTKGERLHLHAEWIEFKHPISREWMSLEVAAAF